GQWDDPRSGLHRQGDARAGQGGRAGRDRQGGARPVRTHGRAPGAPRAGGRVRGARLISTKPTARGRATLGGLLLTTAIALTGSLLSAPSLAATAVQAAMAEWGASRLGVAWSDDRARET